MNWHKRIVLISSTVHSKFGTGFIIHKDDHSTYVVTCAHVIKAISEPEQPIMVEDKPGIVIAYDKDVDLAILRVNYLMSNSILQMGVQAEEGEPFVTVGFQKYGSRLLARRLDGKLGGAGEIAYRASSRRVKVWDLQIVGPHSLQYGYSGAPVISKRGGYVLAIVSSREGRGREGLSISVEAIGQIWLGMPAHLLQMGKTDKELLMGIKTEEELDIKVLRCVKSLEIDYLNKRVPISKVVRHLGSLLQSKNKEDDLWNNIYKLCIWGDLQLYEGNRVGLTFQGKSKLRRYRHD